MAARVEGARPSPLRAWRPDFRRDGAAAAATDGGMNLSPEAKERAIDAWRLEVRAQYKASTDPQVALGVVDAARKRLAEPDLTPGAQATLHMVISGAYGRLVQLNCDKVANGKRAFEAGTRATELAPTKQLVAENYGRTLLSFAGLNWAKRQVVTLGLGLDLDRQIACALAWLAASPDAPLAALLRERLSRHIGDKAERKKAEADLKRLEAADPQGMAAARAELDGDKQRVDAAKG
jgi:hypothetical protein